MQRDTRTRRPRSLFGIGLLTSALLVGPAPAAEPSRDLLTLAEGAVLVSATANPHAAWNLIDGAARTRWDSGGPKFPGPWQFVFELRAPTRLTALGVRGAGKRPAGGVTSSARGIRFEASAQAADSGFVELARIDAAADGESMIELQGTEPVRWLRLSIDSDHAGGVWPYLDEVIAFGEQAAVDSGPRFAGVFEVRAREFIELRQQGATVSGCFIEAGGHAAGTLQGEVVEGVARLTWQRSDRDGIHGTAVLVIDSRGHLNGVRHRQRSRSSWGGPPAAKDTQTPCALPATVANPIAAALDDAGTARIYGILFDFDQASLKPASTPALEQLQQALLASPTLQVDIEGHTDDQGDDAYNLALSLRRAAAVVDWLVAHGIESARLHPVGRGEAEPVVSNDSADDRALNRRVEVVRR